MIYPLQGYTLLEMLCVMVLVAIGLFIIVPTLQNIRMPYEAEQFAQQWSLHLHWARNYALQTGHVIRICGSQSRIACDGRWQDGVLISDVKTTKTLRSFFLKQKAKLHWVSSLGHAHLDFLPDGSAAEQGRFYYCSNPQHSRGIEIVILLSGRIRMVQDVVIANSYC